MTDAERVMLGVVTEPEHLILPFDLEDKLIGSGGIDPLDVEQYVPTLVEYERDPKTKGPILEAKILFPHETKATVGYGRYGVEPGMKITEEQADQFLREDIAKKLNIVTDLFPGFSKMPFEMRNMIVQSAFRGGITGSPDTIDLINQGKLEEASKEFLDHDGYRRAKENSRYTGVAPRMERFADTLLKFAK